MKALLSVLLGLMLFTSLVSISYATPLQPAQSSGDINACVNLKPNDPNYIALGCAGAAHQNGDETPPHHTCLAPGGIASDGVCCRLSISPHNLEVSNLQPDVNCGRP